MKNIKRKKNKGFTLIETLVSLTLFTTVLVMAGGTVVSVININKRNQAISSVVNNLNYSIDSMVRDIKTGYLYKCDYSGSFTISDLKNRSVNPQPVVCQKDLTLISTISGDDTVVKYEFFRANSGVNGYIQKTVYDENGSGSSFNITDKVNVNIEDLKLTVTNPYALDQAETNPKTGQPSVSVIIKGKAGNKNIDVSNFYVQTFISQRLLNLTDFKD